jgi:hypothetical protein
MALKKSIIETREGFSGQLTASDAYWRVFSVSGGKDKVSATVGAYVTKDGQVLTTRQYEFQPKMDGANFIKQAYEHLKSLPDFAGAEDC